MKDFKPFTIELGAAKLSISEHYFGAERIFRVQFSDRTETLVITQTKNYQSTFWTSIPQGRQKEAEKIGALIEAYFKNN